MIKNICICGGGSLGHVCAGVLVSQGYNVSILTGHPANWSNEIVVEAPYNKVFKGHLTSISADPSELIPSSDIVLLCLPGYLIEETLNDISPYLQPSTIVGAIVSSTGFFFMAHKILPEKSKLFGFQRVPFISRVKAYGHSASLLGYKENLNVSMENIDDRDSFVNELSKAFIRRLMC